MYPNKKIQFGATMSQIVPNGIKLTQLVLNSPKQFQNVSNGPKRLNMLQMKSNCSNAHRGTLCVLVHSVTEV